MPSVVAISIAMESSRASSGMGIEDPLMNIIASILLELSFAYTAAIFPPIE